MKCTFKSPSGKICPEEAESNALCFWHDDQQEKTQHNLKSLLEQRANTNEPMAYFKLRHSDLSHINLVNRGSREGYHLRHADLYRCNLQHAHLFGLDLSFSSLMKADLSGANLHSANLEHTNLLGVKLDDAKLEGVQWGDMVRQEWQAEHAENEKEKCQLYSEAEEIYRAVGRVMRNQGMISDLGWFFYREMVTRRKQLPKPSLARFISGFIDVYCGYGEKPLRLLLFSMGVIFSLTLLYANTGLLHNDKVLVFSSSASFSDNISVFLNALYFSVVTFTTLGYGDLSPVGISRMIASLEAFAGSFTIALFVVTFVRRMTR
ncbi:MAG: pentapeptide repeat-containing protein [Gammaproteobacteria bacterium]|nr:pentapeptide repeat-containing protein [Gammaproteobacteria bacterium]